MLKALLLQRAIFFSGELGAQRWHGWRRARPQCAGAAARRAQRAEPRRRVRAAVAASQARRAGQEGGGAGSASGSGVRGPRGMAAGVGRERASERGRELGFGCVDPTVAKGCTNLKHWKMWKKKSTGRYIGLANGNIEIAVGPTCQCLASIL